MGLLAAKKMDIDNIFSGFLSTIAGGIVLALLFFWSREKLFPIPDITGRWYLELETINTAYKPYEGMILRYMALIWREGHLIRGTVEKIYENSTTGEREYIGKNRTRGIVEGYLEKNYLKKDRLLLHVVEDGHGRESSNFYDLIIKSNDEMVGAFNSMVASQDGKVIWKREEF